MVSLSCLPLRGNLACSKAQGGEGGNFHIKNRVLVVLLRVERLKRSTEGASVVSFSLSEKKIMTGDNWLFRTGTLLGVKNISIHPQKTRSWYLLGALL